MSLKKLDLEEFYKKGNANYQKPNTTLPEGIGAVILITPKHEISVYNKEAVDIDGNLVKGLGSHGDTIELILANIFGVTLVGNNFKKNKILNEVISGKELNYVYIRLTNSIAGKQACIEIPYKINQYQIAGLNKLNNEFIRLGVETYVSVTRYDPTKDKDNNDYFNKDVTDISLQEALDYFANHSSQVLSTLDIKNASRLESEYTYLEELDSSKTR